MLPAALLLVAAHFPNSWGKKLKHPMMIGVMFWSFAHLWSNGHMKAVLLSGGFSLYAVLKLIKSDWQQKVDDKPIWLNGVWILISLTVYGFARPLHII